MRRRALESSSETSSAGEDRALLGALPIVALALLADARYAEYLRTHADAQIVPVGSHQRDPPPPLPFGGPRIR